MGKNLKKYGYSVLCTAALLVLAWLGLSFSFPSSQEDAALRFHVEVGQAAEEIGLYEDEGFYYVFLPSYAEMDSVTAVLGHGSTAVLDGVPLTTGTACTVFTVGTDYELELNGRRVGLRFMQSENLPTIYINTLSGTMEMLHRYKNYRETISVTAYDENGVSEFTDFNGSISGRGNATWSYDKKPYALRLSQPRPFLGMDAGADWVLLANAADETNLQNKLVLDLAAQTGLPWTPDCRYADVYLNGEYNGLYLITEKIEIAPNRLNIDSEQGDFLCKVDWNQRWSDLSKPFLTEQGRTIEISAPKNLSNAQIRHITELVNGMEAAIVSGENLLNSELLDLDSWARRYLIDEISANVDSDLLSSYFFYRDGRFFAGPVWDYDRSMGNGSRNENPNSFVAKNYGKASELTSLYYSALYENESFYGYMTELYQQDFLPVVREMIDGGIADLAEELAPAAEMNSLRWRWMFHRLQSQDTPMGHSIQELTAYLDARIAFLNSAWIDGREYCTVQYERAHNSTYRCLSVEKGSLLDTSYMGVDSSVWYNSETREPFDPQQPITEDLLLVRDISPVRPTLSVLVTVLSVIMVVVLLLCFVAVDCYRRMKERRAANEKKRTHVSP